MQVGKSAKYRMPHEWYVGRAPHTSLCPATTFVNEAPTGACRGLRSVSRAIDHSADTPAHVPLSFDVSKFSRRSLCSKTVLTVMSQ